MKQDTPPSTGPRLRWRAVIHAAERPDATRGHPSLVWHLADCTDPPRPEAHCDVGRRLMAADGNPDGHCLLGGVCPRCAEAVVDTTQATEPEQPLAEATTED